MTIFLPFIPPLPHFRIRSFSDTPNTLLTWLKGDDCEETVEGNSLHGKKMFQSTAPTLQLPLVVDYYRLNQNTVGASVSHLVTCLSCIVT